MRILFDLLHVIRVFDDPAVSHPEETVDPQRDLEILEKIYSNSVLLGDEGPHA